MKEPMTTTALKAYLQRNNIQPSLLARKCQIDKGYLSRLLNGQRINPRFPVLASLSAELGLSVNILQKLLQNSYELFIAENNPEVLLEQTSREQMFYYLEQVLDASDQSEILKVADLTKIIRDRIPDSLPLKSCYLCWYEAYSLTIQNKFNASILLFIESSEFKPKYQIEKRFRAKILLGLGTAYMASGNYRQSIRFFRQSLLLWDEGFQVARVYMNLGTLYRRIAKYKLSQVAYEKAYGFGTTTIQLYAISGLIQVALDKKDYVSARKYVIRGYNHGKSFDAPRGKGDLYCTIAEYYLTMGKLFHSELFFRKAILLAYNSGNPRTKHWAEVELALVFLRKGLVNEFNALIEKLEPELSGPEDVLLIAKHLIAKGSYYLNRQEYLSVVRIVQKAYKLLISYSTPELKKCCEMLYEAYTALNEPELAHFYLNGIKKLDKSTQYT